MPKAKKIIVTGNPTKIGTKPVEKASERVKKELGITSNLPIILVFGGSQGAKTINATLIDIISKKLNKEYELIWACGPKQYDVIKEELANQNIDIDDIENTKIFAYIHNMEEVMGVADVVASRSGAMTIAEIAIMGKPAIFIPFPFATENHQEYNAKVLKNVGAAKIILDKDLNSDILSRTLRDILKDKVMLKEMGENAKKVAVTNTLDMIYGEIERLVNK